MKIKLLSLSILVLLVIWIAGFSIFTFLPRENSLRVFYPIAKMSYNRVCHQLPEKSFSINGIHFLVCARCTGIYIGALLSYLLVLVPAGKIFSFNLNYVWMVSGFLLADVFINNILLEAYNKSGAFLTGYLFSFFAVNFIIFELKRNNFFHTSQ